MYYNKYKIMKILLVEDNPILWKSIVRFLKQQSITVEHIKNWTDAEVFWQINNKDIDLVILDIMLPWKTWIEICKTIRQKGIHTPVIKVESEIGKGSEFIINFSN